jgi:hypothetical protein
MAKATNKKVRHKFKLYFYTKTKVQSKKASKALKVEKAAEKAEKAAKVASKAAEKAAKAASKAAEKASTGIKLNIPKRIDWTGVDNTTSNPTSMPASDEPILNLATAATRTSTRNKDGSGGAVGSPRESHSQDGESLCSPSSDSSRPTTPPLAQQQPDPERHEATVDISVGKAAAQDNGLSE